MKEKLNKIRHEIDLIDYKIISLLEKRVSLVEKVAKIKSANPEISYIKANREAEMLTRLVKHSDKIPPQIIVNMWRLIISFSLQHERKFAINCFSDNCERAKRLSREYFSVLTKINYNPKLDEDLHNQDLILFERNDQNLYKFLFLNPKFKIFVNLPDLNEGSEYFSLSNIIVAAQIPIDTISYDVAVIATEEEAGIVAELGVDIAQITIKDKSLTIYELGRDDYLKLAIKHEMQLLGGYISKF